MQFNVPLICLRLYKIVPASHFCVLRVCPTFWWLEQRLNAVIICQVKVKFTLEQVMKAQRESRCTTLLFLQPRC